jgi:ATP-dependent helicase/nuclease subunit B
VQLSVYAALLADDAQEAFFLALDNKQARAIALDESALADVGRAIERLKNIFSRLRSGAPLAAQGIESACRWCELQGLCRKQYWHEYRTTDSPA